VGRFHLDAPNARLFNLDSTSRIVKVKAKNLLPVMKRIPSETTVDDDDRPAPDHDTIGLAAAAEEDDDSKEQLEIVHHDKGQRKRHDRVFIFLLVSQFLINCDYGILAAALVHIRSSMQMSWLGVGSLSSIIYFALSLTTVPIGFVMQRWPGSVQRLLVVSMVGNGACSVLASFAPTAGALTTLLALDGAFQALPAVYLPVWVNQFAPSDASTSWMGYLQNAAQLGTIAGYAATAAAMHSRDDSWWRLTFGAQGAAICACAALMQRLRSGDMILADDVFSPAAVPLAFTASASATGRLLCRFRRHRAFWYTMFAAGALHFVGNGLNYWASLYLVEEIGAGAAAADAMSVVVSIVGPVVGTWAGALYVDYVGGYKDNHERALEACIALSVVPVLALPTMCLSHSVLTVSCALLVMLAFVAALAPALAGIVLDILPEELRPLASGLYGLGINLLGLGMSTFVGGGAIELTGSISFGWRLNSLVVLACPLLLLFSRATLGLQTPMRTVLRGMCEQLRAQFARG
jgi:sugar phosphate permease